MSASTPPTVPPPLTQQPQTPARARRIGVTLRRAFVSLLCVVVGFEITVRVDDWSRFGVPLHERAGGLQELLVRDTQGQHARPGAQYKQFRINARGFRGQEVSDAALRTTSLVIVSGASETFGFYESPGHEWPQQLDNSLRGLCGSRGVTVLNAAFPGMSLPSVEQDVRLRLSALRPSVIVYYPTPWQYLAPAIPQAAPPSRSAPAPISPWRSRASVPIRGLLKRAVPEAVLHYARTDTAARAGSVAGAQDAFVGIPIDRLDSLESHLRHLVGEVRQGGSRIVLVLHEQRLGDADSTGQDSTLVVPFSALREFARGQEYRGAAGLVDASALNPAPAVRELLVRFHEMARQRIRRVAADSTVPLADAAFSSRPDRASLFEDLSHFTDSGAAGLASAAASKVAPLLGCRAPTLAVSSRLR